MEQTDIANGANLETNNESEIDDNLDDPYYEESNETLDSEDGLDKDVAEEGKKRRRKPAKAEWDRQKTRLKRMRGEGYLGYTRTKYGKVFHNKMRQPKTM